MFFQENSFVALKIFPKFYVNFSQKLRLEKGFLYHIFKFFTDS